jgi:hypothetical protein
MKNHWTKDELKTYLLIYCANADFCETKTEIEYIKKHTHNGHFTKMHAEFDADSDFESIQKIKHSLEEHGYENFDNLISEIKGLFVVDSKLDILEENLLRMLKHLLN